MKKWIYYIVFLLLLLLINLIPTSGRVEVTKVDTTIGE